MTMHNNPIKTESSEDIEEVLLKKVFTESFPLGLWILTLLISPILFMLFQNDILSGGSIIESIVMVYFFMFFFSLITSIPALIVFYLIYISLVGKINSWWISFVSIAIPATLAVVTLYFIDLLWVDFLTYYLLGLVLSFMILVYRKRDITK